VGNVTDLLRILWRVSIHGQHSENKRRGMYQDKERATRTVCRFPWGFDAKTAGSLLETHK
jgi:hypothetical protein